VSSKDNSNWWKQSSETLNYEDFKAPASEEPKIEEYASKQFKRVEIEESSDED
jgi:hypothetical protein